MPIVPDTKDWTWVVERPCPECGFDSSTVSRDGVAALILANVEAWPPILTEPESVLRRLPAEDRWSPLEYACHVRDVYRLYDYRLGLMLTHDDPTYPNWDQDESADADAYNTQSPALVARELVEAGRGLAASFAAVSGEQWSRTGNRSDGASFTVDSFSRYLVHDPIHHLHDVRPSVSRS